MIIVIRPMMWSIQIVGSSQLTILAARLEGNDIPHRNMNSKKSYEEKGRTNDVFIRSDNDWINCSVKISLIFSLKSVLLFRKGWSLADGCLFCGREIARVYSSGTLLCFESAITYAFKRPIPIDHRVNSIVYIKIWIQGFGNPNTSFL